MGKKRALIIYLARGAIFVFRDEKIDIVSIAESSDETIASALKTIFEKQKHTKDMVRFILSPTLMQINQFSLPVMKRGDLFKVMERKVSLLQGFEDGRNWGYQPLQKVDNIENVLVYVARHPLIRSLIQSSEKSGLLVHSILPLPLLPLFQVHKGGDGQVLLMILEKSVIVRVHKDTKTLFLREFSCNVANNDSAEIDRLKREVERTLLYVKQQYQIFTPELYYIGDENQQIEQSIEGVLYRGAIHAWAFKALPHLENSLVDHANILPKSYLDERKKVKKFYLVIILLIITFLCTLGSYIYVAHKARVAQETLIALGVDEGIDSLQSELADLEQIAQNISTSKSVISYIKSETHPPVAGWTISYISKIIPPKLLLSRFEMSYEKQGSYWLCRIEGFAPRSSVESAQLLRKFEESLTLEPIRLTIDRTWVEQWKENLQVGDSREKDSISKRFYIEGRVF